MNRNNCVIESRFIEMLLCSKENEKANKILELNFGTILDLIFAL